MRDVIIQWEIQGGVFAFTNLNNLTRRDWWAVRIYLYKDGAPIVLGENDTLVLSVKERAGGDVAFGINGGWTAPAKLGGFYGGVLAVDSAVLDDLFAPETEGGDEGARVELVMQLRIYPDQEGEGPTASSQLALTLNNDVARGEDAVPPADPEAPFDALDDRYVRYGVEQALTDAERWNVLGALGLDFDGPFLTLKKADGSTARFISID